MYITQMITQSLKNSAEMLKATLGDFSDADMMVRPCPGANHATWQLGHLIKSESEMVMGASGKPSALPEGFDAMFSKEASKIDDAAKFGKFAKKEELLKLFEKTRSATIAWVDALPPADLEKPAPEKMRNWVPTLGHLADMQPVHAAMHLGQFQVIRRKLGKPVLF